MRNDCKYVVLISNQSGDLDVLSASGSHDQEVAEQQIDELVKEKYGEGAVYAFTKEDE